MAQNGQKGLLDTGGLVEMLDSFGQQALDSVAEQGMLRLGNILEATAVELAPHLTGELEGSTNVRVTTRGDRIVAEVTFNAPHAAAAHELPEDSRGAQTQRKPGNEYGQAGPKYMERPLRGMVALMSKDLGKALQEFWTRATPAKKGKKGRRGK